MQRQRKYRGGVPLWARVVAIILGLLVILWVVQLRYSLGGVELVASIAVGLIVLACGAIPSLRRSN